MSTYVTSEDLDWVLAFEESIDVVQPFLVGLISSHRPLSTRIHHPESGRTKGLIINIAAMRDFTLSDTAPNVDDVPHEDRKFVLEVSIAADDRS